MTSEVRLTELVASGGCAAKIRPGDLGTLLEQVGLFKGSHPAVIAGGDSPDDAVVLATPSGDLIVQTLDFFPPVCDDPYLFGQIAAANALSDVYAMGGRPYTAMNICCFPLAELGLQVLAEILRGGHDQIRAAGALPVGGHTIEDRELKYGLAVTGLVQRENLATKNRAKPGDLLVLSKPLGTGIISAAIKKKLITAKEAENAYQGMRTLNARACCAMNAAGVCAATDVTGYGLLGHSWEMVRGLPLKFIINASKLPTYEGVRSLAIRGACPGGSKANRKWIEEAGCLSWHIEIDEVTRIICTDAQTSGGLLMCWPEQIDVPEDMWVIGKVDEARAGQAQLIVQP